jgi:putative transposase
MSDPYSMDLRERVVEAYARGGHTFQAVAEQFRVCARTVAAWVRRQRETGSVAPRKKGGGNPTPLRGPVLEALRTLVQEQPDATVQQDAEALVQRTGVQTSRSSVMRALQRAGLTLKKSASLPPSSKPRAFRR